MPGLPDLVDLPTKPNTAPPVEPLTDTDAAVRSRATAASGRFTTRAAATPPADLPESGVGHLASPGPAASDRPRGRMCRT